MILMKIAIKKEKMKTLINWKNKTIRGKYKFSRRRKNKINGRIKENTGRTK